MNVLLAGATRRRSPLLSRRRTLFTLPDPFSLPFLPGSDKPPDAQKYHEEKVLPYEPSQLYAVVADVARYPRFVPFCTGSRILRVSERPQQGNLPSVTDMDAELTVGFLTFKESYVSRVTCRPFESVQAVASSSTPLFKTLETKWHFRPIYSSTDSGQEDGISTPRISTLVTLDLTFAFANPIYAKISGAFFTQISTMMVNAFEDECSRVYTP